MDHRIISSNLHSHHLHYPIHPWSCVVHVVHSSLKMAYHSLHVCLWNSLTESSSSWFGIAERWKCPPNIDVLAPYLEGTGEDHIRGDVRAVWADQWKHQIGFTRVYTQPQHHPPLPHPDNLQQCQFGKAVLQLCLTTLLIERGKLKEALSSGEPLDPKAASLQCKVPCPWCSYTNANTGFLTFLWGRE